MLAGLVRRSPGWRAWIAVLAITLAGAASTATVWHGDHASDQGCAVCQLRHQPAADLSGPVHVGPADAAELVDALPLDGCITSDGLGRLPARAPPAQVPLG